MTREGFLNTYILSTLSLYHCFLVNPSPKRFLKDVLPIVSLSAVSPHYKTMLVPVYSTRIPSEFSVL